MEADLLAPGSYDAAGAGCAFLFFIAASPFFIDAADPQAQLVELAVAGTRSVLAAAAKAGATLRHVVLTSLLRGGVAQLRGWCWPWPPGWHP